MADGIEIDTADVARLAVDLGRTSAKVLAVVEAVSAKAALNIKNQMVTDASGHETFPHFPRSIGYERRLTLGSVEYEIGPDKNGPQGALGNILYFGTSRDAPVLNLLGPLEAEEPNYLKYLAAAAEGTFE